MMDEFAAALFKHIKVAGANDCWEYTSKLNNSGYGHVGWRGRHFLAHRASYLLFFGFIPKGKNVCHKCDNRKCVNPSHLFIGTQSENIQDAKLKGRLVPRRRRLEDQKIQDVIRAVMGGKAQVDVAQEFGINRKQVSKYVVKSRSSSAIYPYRLQ